jgi:hypothetical protein
MSHWYASLDAAACHRNPLHFIFPCGSKGPRPSRPSSPLILILFVLTTFFDTLMPLARCLTLTRIDPTQRVSSLRHATSSAQALKTLDAASSLPSLIASTYCDNAVVLWTACPSPHSAKNAVGAHPYIDQINFG